MGCHSGVCTRLRLKYNESMLNVPCSNHRMALADAADSDAPPILRVKKLMNRTFWYFQRRPQAWKKVGSVHKMFGGRCPLKLQQRSETRWLYESRRIKAFRSSKLGRYHYYKDSIRKASKPTHWLNKAKKLLAKHTLKLKKKPGQAKSLSTCSLIILVLILALGIFHLDNEGLIN